MTPEDYLLHTHTHVLENIKLADQKATAFIAIDSAIISALFGAKLLILNPSDIWLTLLSITTFVLLGCAIAVGGFVIWPRVEKIADRADGGNLAFPSKITRLHKTPVDLAQEVSKAIMNSELQNELAALVLVRARINNEKYVWLERCVVLSAFGFLCAATFVIIHSM